MKKFLLFAAFVAALFTASAQGGPGGDPATMRQRMKERVKPQLIEKTGLSDAEAEKVLDINFEAQRMRRELRMDNSVSEEDRTKKATAIDEEMKKKYKDIPLTDEQMKSVNAFFEEMNKNRPQRREGSGNGNG